MLGLQQATKALKMADKGTKIKDMKNAQAKKLFKQLDTDNSGKLVADNLKVLCSKLGMKATTTDMALVIQEMDTDGDGSIDVNEFMSWWEKNGNDKFSNSDTYRRAKQDEAKELFEKVAQKYKTSASRILTEVELTQLCKELNFKVSKKELQAMMADMDLEGKGSVDIFQFAAWWEENGYKKFSDTKTAKTPDPKTPAPKTPAPQKFNNPMAEMDVADDGGGQPEPSKCGACSVQ